MKRELFAPMSQTPHLSLRSLVRVLARDKQSEQHTVIHVMDNLFLAVALERYSSSYKSKLGLIPIRDHPPGSFSPHHTLQLKPIEFAERNP